MSPDWTRSDTSGGKCPKFSFQCVFQGAACNLSDCTTPTETCITFIALEDVLCLVCPVLVNGAVGIIVNLAAGDSFL